MKKYLVSAAVVAASVPSLVFAEGESTITPVAPTITPIVDVQTLQTNLLGQIQPWITAGLGIGLVVFAVYVGYRMIRKFTR